MPAPEEDSQKEQEKEDDVKDERETDFETEYNSDDTLRHFEIRHNIKYQSGK